MRARASWAAMCLATMGAACSAPSSGLGDDSQSRAGSPGASGESSNDAGFVIPSSGAGGGGTSRGGSGSSPVVGGGGASEAGTAGAEGSGGAGNTGGAGGGAASTGGSTSAGGSAGAGGAGCAPLTVDCNQDPSDGCEISVGDDIANCGTCNNVCPTRANATPYCFIGECTNSCSRDSGDCNGDPTDGCETNTLTDRNNCGACRMNCGTAQCVDGACSCATTSVTAKKVPLDIYIMFDSSGSMDENVTGGTKWDVIKNALIAFVNNPGSADIGVGIGYFPVVTGFLGTSVSCNVADYSTPSVGIGLLPPVATAIVNSLNGRNTAGGTPTSVALQGAYAYAVPWQAAHPLRKTIVVLATDGNPTSCDPQDPATIGSTIVAPARTGNPSLLTFVIGVGNSLTSLNTLAQAGGTGQAFIVDTAGADPGGQFLAAMNAIRGSVTLGCEYQIPSPPGGGAPDYTRVNVQYTPSGGSPFTLGKVADVGSCTVTQGGWYYDNPAAPTRIQLCPSTCSAIGVDPSATIEVLLGCPSTG